MFWFFGLFFGKYVCELQTEEVQNVAIFSFCSASLVTLSFSHVFFSLLQLDSLPHENSEFGLHHLHQLVWARPSTLLGVSSQSHDQSHDMLVEMELVTKAPDKEANHSDAAVVIEAKWMCWVVRCTYTHSSLLDNWTRCHVTCPGHVLCLHGNPNTGTVAVELADGTVWRYASGNCLCVHDLPTVEVTERSSGMILSYP